MGKRIYILGIGGTLMGSIARLAQEAGHDVSGSDKALYPPMSDQLAAAGITIYEGFDPAQLTPRPDLVIVGNAGLPRGHPGIEYILEQQLPYTSGAEWLGREILHDRWVLAVSGTHGKTTTTSLLAWIMDQAGLDPGFLIGGVPRDFGTSARLGARPFFVVEADEYDTSYFDRRSKFVHYRPRTLVINNLEYDHADIFPNLDAIQLQFHHLLRTVAGSGLIIVPEHDEHVDHVLQMGCWTPVARLRAGQDRPRRRGGGNRADDAALWCADQVATDGSSFRVSQDGTVIGTVDWSQLGIHNVHNALAAIAAAHHAGVAPAVAIDATCRFGGVARRLEVIASDARTTVYDDFAHHPTAIRTTLQGLRNNVGSDEIIAVIEPRSHTMSLGTLHDDLATCTAAADRAIWFRGENIKWDLGKMVHASLIPAQMEDQLDRLLETLLALARNDAAPRRHIVFMSNGGFGGIQRRFADALRLR